MDFSLSDEQQMLRDLCARFRDDHVRPLERLVLAREAEGGDGWLKHVRGQEVDRFIPIAYEMCGTWGTAARSFFKFVVKCAGFAGN